MRSAKQSYLIVFAVLSSCVGCDNAQVTSNSSAPLVSSIPKSPWLGIPSAVNQVVVALHEGTGWLLNKSEVSVKKSGEVQTASNDGGYTASFQIAVRFGGESFETTARDVPCDSDGIPTEAAVDRLRVAVEDIKSKMKRLQN